MGWSLIGPAIGLAGSLLGGGKKGGGGGSTSKSGWEALPKEAKEAYINTYLPQVLDLYNQGPNAYQQQYDKSLGGGLAGLLQELPGYMDMYRQNVTNPTLMDIQRNADMQKKNLNAAAARNGLGGLLNSNLGIQSSLVQENADRLKNQTNYTANRDMLNSGLALRGQTLEDLMRAGERDYTQVSRLASLLGSFPGGSTQNTVNPSAPQPNTWDKIAGLGTALGGMQNNLVNNFSSTPWLYGGTPMNGASYGNWGMF